MQATCPFGSLENDSPILLFKDKPQGDIVPVKPLNGRLVLYVSDQ